MVGEYEPCDLFGDIDQTEICVFFWDFESIL